MFNPTLAACFAHAMLAAVLFSRLVGLHVVILCEHCFHTVRTITIDMIS